MAKTRRRVRKSVARSRRVRVRTRSHMRGKAKTRKTKRSRKSTRVRRHRKLKGGATAGQTPKKRVHIHCENDRDCTGKYKCVDGACVEVSEYYLSRGEMAAKMAALNEDSVPPRPQTMCERMGNCFNR